MMKKENESLHKEYVELKTSIELLLKRRRILKNAVFPLIVIIFFVSVGLVKSAKEIPATAIFLIDLLGFVWVILITGGYMMHLKKLKKIRSLIDEEAKEWKYKEEVLKTHITIMEKIKEQPPFLSEIFIAFCVLFITLSIVPYIIFLGGAGVIMFGPILIGGITLYVFMKHKKEKNFDNLYARYLSLIEKKLFN